MIKVYLNNHAHWFTSHAEAAEFMRNNPAATFREFNQYWNAAARKWCAK